MRFHLSKYMKNSKKKIGDVNEKCKLKKLEKLIRSETDITVNVGKSYSKP